MSASERLGKQDGLRCLSSGDTEVYGREGEEHGQGGCRRRWGGLHTEVYIQLITEAPTLPRTAYLETFYGLVTRSSGHPPPTLCYTNISYDQL